MDSEMLIRRRFQKRRETLERACRLYGNSSLIKPNKPVSYVPMPLYRPVMNVSVRYCAIAKTACTTWTAFFASIRNYMSDRGIQGSEDRRQADDEVYFTFVREPYARLLSAYVDKLLTPNEMFWRIAGSFIVKEFRPGASRKSRPCGHDVTFPEFIRYVIHSQQTGENRNDHFIPTHDHCGMCRVPYRYIGHLETMQEDMAFITKAIHSPITYGRTYDSDTIRQNAKMVLWKDRRLKVQRCMDLDEASRRLWRKYQIRGLISKDDPFPYSRGTAVNISYEQFIANALEAHERSKNDPGTKAQRKESLMEAFAQVPIEDRLQMQQTLFLDFQMFGFDPFPEEVFPKEPYTKRSSFSYFEIY